MAKITIDLPGNLLTEMKEAIPWGLRRHVIAAVLTLIVAAAKRDGSTALGAIMDNKFRLVPVLERDEHEH